MYVVLILLISAISAQECLNDGTPIDDGCQCKLHERLLGIQASLQQPWR